MPAILKRSKRERSISVRVSRELDEQVGRIAEERGADKSDIIREAVIKFVNAISGAKKLEEVAS